MQLIERMGQRALGAVATAALAACGDGGDAGPDAAAEVSLVRAPSGYAAAYCERLFECCTADEITEMLPGALPPVTDLASCRDHVTRVFGNEFVDDTMRAEAAGHARYDGVAMAACLAHVRDDPCELLARAFRLMTLPEDCPPVRIPLAAIGASCDHDFQCTSDYCEGGTETQRGVCRPLPALGEVCPDSRCIAGTYCDRNSDPAGRCAALRLAGEPCTSFLECVDFACPGAPDGVCGPPSTCNGLP